MEPLAYPHHPKALRAAVLPRTLGLSWPLVIALAAVFGVAVLLPAGRTLADADTYWHLATGRWIVEHGIVPRTDPFSHTMPGVPWTAHEWLSELVLQAVHGAAGWAGLVALTAVALALTLVLLMRFLLRRMEPLHALLFVGLAAMLAQSHVLARPHMLAWPLLTLWVAALVEAGEARRAPPWWLLAVMPLWANLHGSFTLGVALSVPLALEAVLAHPAPARRGAALRWAGFVALAACAGLATPAGLEGYAYTLHVMSLKLALALIGEWKSPDFHRWQPLEGWLLLALALGLSGRVRVPALRLVLLLGLVHLALKHQRNIALLGLLSPLLLAAPLAQHWQTSVSNASNAAALDRWFQALAAPSRWKARLACLAAIGVLGAGVLPARMPQPQPDVTPQRAVDAALATGVQGKVFNDYSFGGYLIFRGVPVFIDGRADMYGDDLLRSAVEAMNLKDRREFLAFLDRHDVGWTLLQPGRPAIALLDGLAGWRRLHADEHAVVHVRSTAAQP